MASPRRKAKPLFLMAIVDHDKRQFTLKGPMSDDTGIINAVVRAQGTGRHVTCSSGDCRPIPQVARQYAAQMGYEYVKDIPL